MTSGRFLLTESEEGRRLREGIFVKERHWEGLNSEDSRLKLGGLELVGLGLPSLQSSKKVGRPRGQVLLTLTAVWLQTRGFTSLNLSIAGCWHVARALVCVSYLWDMWCT